jgi:hypothetical protein
MFDTATVQATTILPTDTEIPDEQRPGNNCISVHVEFFSTKYCVMCMLVVSALMHHFA